MADVVAAVVAALDDELTLDRIYGARLPKTEAQNMPRKAIVVRASGGGQLASGWMPTVDGRIDLRCYGATPYEAAELSGEASVALHGISDVATDHGRILWCALSGGATQLTEPDTNWDLVLTTWQVYGTWLDT